MTRPLAAGARPAGRIRSPLPRALLLAGGLAVAGILAGCGNVEGSPTPTLSSAPTAGSTAATESAQPTPRPSPSPTPLPTPRYTNAPDPELSGLIPAQVAGLDVVVPPVDEFAYTPGDFGAAYGDLGRRFESLQVAYIERPRLSLYAARVWGTAATTEELEPHLETAGRYVGIAGLVRDPWELTEIDGRLAWVRPEDNATAAGTMIYTWATDQFVFLMIGVDDAVNRALFAELPAETAPTPTPRPSRTPSSGSPTATESSAPS